jgi:hypothetical protein
VDVPADMTRLTLDTIALCGFDYRFNSFYRDTPHPFVLAMLNTLEAAQAIARELPIQTKLKPGRAKKVRAEATCSIPSGSTATRSINSPSISAIRLSRRHGLSAYHSCPDCAPDGIV